MFRLASIAGKSTHPRRAVVTGAGGGIGAALATQLATAGTALVLVDNNTDALARVAGRCSDLGVPVSSWDVDVADHAAVVEAVRHIVEDDGPPDALFNVAGLIHHGLLVDSDVADIQRIIQVDLLGTISCCQALLPALATHARARIVNVSSAFGLVGVAGYSAYNAAKFAVRGFTEALQQETPANVAVSWIGKLKTGFQMTAIGMMIWEIPTFGLPWYEIGYALLFVASALTIWSMVIYLKAAWPMMRSQAK